MSKPSLKAQLGAYFTPLLQESKKTMTKVKQEASKVFSVPIPGARAVTSFLQRQTDANADVDDREKVETVYDRKPKEMPEIASDDLYSIRNLLPYETYDEASGVFENKHSLGFALELSPALGADESFVKNLADLFADVLPGGGDIQFLMYGSPKIGHLLDAMQENNSKRGGKFAKLAEKQANYFRRAAYQSLISQHDLVFRNNRLFIFFSLPKTHEDASIDRLVYYRNDIESSLKSMSLFSRNFSVEGFLSLLSDLLQPSESLYSDKKVWDMYNPIADQVTSVEQAFSVTPDSVIFEGWETAHHARVLTVEQYPKQVAQWNTGENIGQLFNASQQIPCPYLFSFHIHLRSKEKSNIEVQKKMLMEDKKANSMLVKYVPAIRREFEDWKWVRTRLEDGDSLADTSYHVVLFGKEDKIRYAERKVKDLFQSNSWKLSTLRHQQLPALLACLPFTMSEGLYEDFKSWRRLKTMTVFNAVNIAPMQGEWRGHDKPLMMLPGRRGQLTFWHPFANEGNFNVAVTAKSRSGKSVFVQEYIANMVGSGGRCWVIDVGHSYEKTCKALDGEFVEFSMDNPLCINPFSNIQNFEESLPMLVPLIGSMARSKVDTTEEEDAWIEKAITHCFRERGNDMTITHIRDYLESTGDAIAKNLGHLLVSYAKGGMYSMFFEGKSDISFDNPFVVFELLGLKNKKELQRVVLLVLMAQVHTAMYLGDRHQYKSCIIDEAWDLFGEGAGAASKFIETGYRTAGRHNGNFISITQSINDYYKSASSIAAWENADLKVILMQLPDTIEQVKRQGRFSIDPFLERLFKSLHKVEGAYSECVIVSPDGYSAHRIILDPYTRILFSSKGSEFQAVKDLEAKGYSLDRAVSIVAGEDPEDGLTAAANAPEAAERVVA